MAVDSSTATASTSTATTTAAAPAKSEAQRKKEEEAKAEREKKYPPPHKAGIVLAAEKKVTSKLLEHDRGSSEKVFLINGNIVSAAAGITADANSLVSYSRNAAQVCLRHPSRQHG